MSFDVNKYRTETITKLFPKNEMVLGTLSAINIFVFSILLCYDQYVICITLTLIQFVLLPILDHKIKYKQKQIDNLFEEKYREFERKLKEHVQSRK